MISQEPTVKVGIFEQHREVRGMFNGTFTVNGLFQLRGSFTVRSENGRTIFTDSRGNEVVSEKEIHCARTEEATFTLHDVRIGIQFHWERKESQTFQGNLTLVACEDGTITAINEISLEEYLASVISSEMSAEAPIELLKAHAITSRSWLVAMLEREHRNVDVAPERRIQRDDELICWYDREDHDIFDVCADDHCQRYQGITKIISKSAAEATEATRGIFLVFKNQICDARFHKACGGLSEEFENTWEERHVPYLECVSDSSLQHSKISTEREAEDWILSHPDVYCNTTDAAVLHQILPSYDRETTNFFRWALEYDRRELEEIIHAKSGIDFGTIKNLVPIQRGPSGRINKLKIEGTKRTMTVGKELEIRRWFSKSHLYSSAFVVMAEREDDGTPKRFMFYGAGWGHGVGLCQIGAAVMAAKGFQAEEIVKHYFRNARIQKLY
jgi:SpoIID/LytB domain protein